MNRTIAWGGGRMAAALLMILAIALPAGAGEVSEKLQKQIKIVEEVLSEVLVESPYWLVSAGGPVVGTYLEGYGAVFSFDVSLVGSKSDGISWGKLGKGFIIWDKDKKEFTFETDEDEDADDEKPERGARRDDRRYARGKEELAETLIDYGETLSELPDGEWVALAVALDEEHDYFDEQELRRLIIKAKAGDLKRHAGGGLSDAELAQRIVTQEY